MTDTGRCLRPNCRFSVLPTVTDGGGLKLYAYCSALCQLFCEAAVKVAQSEFSPAIEREAERLHVVARLLDLREHPAELEMTYA
ncbi:hypothetical protein ACFWBC_19940 [Streptomyces sp. NPDC059985]|uniref:hypothetical protein n=1 Tax=Streptomyces sp. NPDC059985 TaxID=3347025 RepID=UPI003683F2A1